MAADAVEGDLRVGMVVRDHDVVLPSPCDRSLQELQWRDRGRRVVRIAQPDELRSPRDVGRDIREVEQESVLSP